MLLWYGLPVFHWHSQYLCATIQSLYGKVNTGEKENNKKTESSYTSIKNQQFTRKLKKCIDESIKNMANGKCTYNKLYPAEEPSTIENDPVKYMHVRSNYS